MTNERYAGYKKLFKEIVDYSTKKFDGMDFLFGEVLLEGLNLSNKIQRAERQNKTLRNLAAIKKEERMVLLAAYVMKLFNLETVDMINEKFLTEKNIQIFCEDQERIYLKTLAEQPQEEKDV